MKRIVVGGIGMVIWTSDRTAVKTARPGEKLGLASIDGTGRHVLKMGNFLSV